MKQTVGVLVQSLETLGGGERVAVNLCNALEPIFDIRLIQFYETSPCILCHLLYRPIM